MNLSSQRIWCYLCEKEVFAPNQRRTSVISNESDTSRYSVNDKMMSYEKSGAGGGGGGGDSCDSSAEEDGIAGSLDGNGDRVYLNGLVGLQNIANTCYMNAALQALSNTPALTGFFLDCGSYVEMAMVANAGGATGRGGAKPALAKSYHRLIKEMWCNKRRNSGELIALAGKER
jgi:ubiquitin carboxyl-terminal hydrolase 20/33